MALIHEEILVGTREGERLFLRVFYKDLSPLEFEIENELENKKQVEIVKKLADFEDTLRQRLFLLDNPSIDLKGLAKRITKIVYEWNEREGKIKEEKPLPTSESLDNWNVQEAHNKIMAESRKREDVAVKMEVLSLLSRKLFNEATEELVTKIYDGMNIYTTKLDKTQEMLVYKEGIYEPNGESHIKERLRKIMEEAYSEWLANQVLAKIRADTMVDPTKLFQEQNFHEIPVENGILDLNTFELLPFDPKKIFLTKLPTKFDIEATCPLIDKFLSDVLASPEDKNVFYELAGFGLYKDYFMEKAFMLVGNGRNGKTKSIELLKRLVGVGNCASVPLSSMDPNSPFISTLWKRYFNLAGDISSKDLRDTGMFKQLTGRDLISANRKYLNVIEFMNYAKLVFACNELPRVYDYSDGFWERWVLLEFPYKFVEQEVFDSSTEEEKKMLKIKDPNIIDKISTPEEMSGLLNCALAGLQRLRNNKKFSYTKGTVEVKNRWIRKADSFMAFCMDCIEEDYETRITKKDMRRKYKEFCQIHKVGGVSDKAIKATLQEMFGVMEEFVTVFESHQEWVWTGIKWKNLKILEKND